MKQERIYPKDWMEWHPYTRIGKTDRYYTNIANDIFKIIDQEFYAKDPFGEKEKMKRAACCITAYFEDIISKIGIWKAFTDECKRLYDSYLPFYQLTDEEYFNDEINVEDIRFLLWHHIQQTRDKSIINPENEAIEVVAQQIYELLSDEFETAPENEELQALFSQDKRYDSFAEYKEFLCWFHYHSYLNAFNNDELQKDLIDFLDEDSDQEPSMDFLRLLTYATTIFLSFTSRKNMLSLTSPKWLSLIYGPQYQQAEDFSNVELRKSAPYLFNSMDEKFIHVTNMDTDEKLCINRTSITPKTANSLVPDESVLNCTLVFYAGTWNEPGDLIVVKKDNSSLKEIQEEKEYHEKNEKAYNLFMEKSNGVPFAFFKSHEEYHNFVTQVLGLKLSDGYRLPKGAPQQLMIRVTRKEGLHFTGEGVACIKSPLNPFYDSEIAKEKAINFYANPSLSTFEFAYYLHEHQLLPDAGLKSINGHEYGAALLENNWDFIVRYFLQDFRP